MYTKIRFSIAIVCLLFFLPRSAAADADLVGWWKFDEGSGHVANDASGHGNDGIVLGASWCTNGGTALRFDGHKDCVVIFDSDSISVGNRDYTIAAWIYPKSLAAEQGIVAKVKNRSNKEYALGTDRTCLRLDVEMNSNGGRAETVENVLTADSWQHIAVTFDSSTRKAAFYRNAVLQAVDAQSIDSLPDELDDHLYIGRWGGVYGVDVEGPRHFNGLIKDVRIYSSILTETELGSIYTNAIVQTTLAEATQEAAQRAYETLQRIGNWSTNTALKKRRGNEIAGSLLVITRVKEATGHPIDNVLQEYYRIAEEFPDCTYAVGALCRIAILDSRNGLQYARRCLEEDLTTPKLASFYASVIKHYLGESHYTQVHKYVEDFVERYASAKSDPALIIMLMKSIGPVDNSVELAKMVIEQNALHSVDLEACCAVLRWLVCQPCQVEDAALLLELARWCRAKFARTKLATCAAAVLADEKYQHGQYVAALQVFKPRLFGESKSEPEIIEDIDSTLRFYSTHTLRRRAIDLAQVYKALAERSHRHKQNIAALHCYKQGAKAKGIDLTVFEQAAAQAAKCSNSRPGLEIWFWKGLLAAEEADFTAASLAYQRFLAHDNTSALAARAFYDLARAEMTLGRDASRLIGKARAISPCAPVLLLDAQLNNPANHRAGED
ncbi:MAG: LamG-like jellyroll fold domain-containing protein [Planctomycetota bacterium]|jgi:hypothetical protein